MKSRRSKTLFVSVIFYIHDFWEPTLSTNLKFVTKSMISARNYYACHSNISVSYFFCDIFSISSLSRRIISTICHLLTSSPLRFGGLLPDTSFETRPFVTIWILNHDARFSAFISVGYNHWFIANRTSGIWIIRWWSGIMDSRGHGTVIVQTTISCICFPLDTSDTPL